MKPTPRRHYRKHDKNTQMNKIVDNAKKVLVQAQHYMSHHQNFFLAANCIC